MKTATYCTIMGLLLFGRMDTPEEKQKAETVNIGAYLLFIRPGMDIEKVEDLLGEPDYDGPYMRFSDNVRFFYHYDRLRLSVEYRLNDGKVVQVTGYPKGIRPK